MVIKLIIFDIGGVLSTDSSKKKDPFFITALKYGLPKDDLDKIFFKYFDEYHSKKTLSQYNFWKNVLTDLGEKVSSKKINDTISLFEKGVLCDISKDMLKLLQSLSRKYKLVLLSNSWRDMDASVFSSKYLRYFDRICLTHLNSKKKPLREAYVDAISGFDVLPSECVFVDDKIKNIEGANNVGINGVVYKNINNLKIKLKELGVIF